MQIDELRRFWDETLREAGVEPRDVTVTESEYAPVGMLESRWDVSWAGLGGARVGGWLYQPLTSRAKQPAVVYFPGYGGQVWGRDDFARRGYVTFAASPRFGSLAEASFKEAVPSPISHGLESPETYAFRGIYADAAQAVSFVRSLPEVDEDRVYAVGASCGAACAIAAAAVAGNVRAVSAECPFMTDFEYVIEHVRTAPYSELTDRLAEHPETVGTARRTLGYFDTVSLASLVEVPTILSYGEADVVCPPATIQTLFDALHVVKALVAYPGRQHARGADFIDLSMAFFQSHA